jgi:hypothetical protein
MELLGHVGHVKSPFGPFRDSVTFGKIVLVRLEIVLILIRDRCTVFAKRTVYSEIILDASDELLGDVGHVESLFGPFGDSVRVGAR